MRALHGLFAVLFVVSAGLQYNDPDPLPWIAIYLAGAAVAVASLAGKPVRLAALAVAAACAIWMVLLSGGMLAFIDRGDLSLLAATMQAGDPVIEEAREFLGLAIILLYVLMVATLRGFSSRVRA